MPRPDRHTFIVQHRPDIVWMYAVHHEGEDTGLLPGGADQPQAFEFPHPFGGRRQQLVLPRRDGRQTERVQVIDCRPQADHLGDHRRAGLELGGYGRPG